MTELPKTETELQALIDEAVKKATDDLVAKHDGAMASVRKKHDDEIKKIKEEANLNADQLAEKKAKELEAQKEAELSELRSFKKQSIIKEKLTSKGLPSMFVNDSRLLSAEEGDLDKMIEQVKTEYDSVKPQGATVSTVVKQSTATATPQVDEKQRAYNAMGSVLEKIVK